MIYQISKCTVSKQDFFGEPHEVLRALFDDRKEEGARKPFSWWLLIQMRDSKLSRADFTIQIL